MKLSIFSIKKFVVHNTTNLIFTPKSRLVVLRPFSVRQTESSIIKSSFLQFSFNFSSHFSSHFSSYLSSHSISKSFLSNSQNEDPNKVSSTIPIFVSISFQLRVESLLQSEGIVLCLGSPVGRGWGIFLFQVLVEGHLSWNKLDCEKRSLKNHILSNYYMHASIALPR